MTSALERLRKAVGESANPDKKKPSAILGFEKISRYWDKHIEYYGAKILPGEYYVTKNDEFIITVLGSCISACIWDEVAGVGGMNHFMLPDGDDSGAWRSSSNSAPARYGNIAMERLVNDILKNGGKKERLKVKIFGGGQMLKMMTDIGQRNILFVEDYIRTEGLNKVGEDVGNVYPRKVMFFPKSGRVRLKRLQSVESGSVARRESDYLKRVKKEPDTGSVELF
ncbi:MAG: chemoreceptor glutamine deamidase CheD [Gammaproteobacteria bacterium]|nr:MAG: chemoreceptor glutamine deamidase CheD [Gammaproteobacteria bacterium]